MNFWGERLPTKGYSFTAEAYNDDMESYVCGVRVGADFCNGMFSRDPNADQGFDKFYCEESDRLFQTDGIHGGDSNPGPLAH